jgi:response regulator RpfG family c-di-GMP phosphodiesterase
MPGTTVLVADDEPHIRHLLEYKLSRTGYRVLTASDGKAAYTLACRERPDLVITDYQMPGGDGLELSRQLKANDRTASTPVLMLTARGYKLLPSDLATTNIKSVMEKPFSPRDLLALVEELTQGTAGADDDRRATTEQDPALRRFSMELDFNYEQVSLLYRLGRCMNWLTRPEDYVSTVCNSIGEVLDFSWVAVTRKAEPTSGHSDVVTAAGTLPCPRPEFDELARRLLSETTGDGWTSLLEPEDHWAATRLGSQVVAEPVLAGGEVAGLILAANKVGVDHEVTSIERQLLDAIADYLGAFLHNVRMYEEQRRLFMGSIQALTAAIDAKDRYTRGHSERVALMGSRLAAASGMSAEQVERVRISGLVHDVGKIGVPEAVLRKPGRLTDEEFEQIKRHPVIGHTILKDIPALEDILPGVLYHHERWDGRGYPEGLAGERIPLFGRLLAVADAFDAMSSNRAYRPAIPREKVLREIADGAGTQFDPELAKIFLTLDLTDFDAAVARHHAQEAAA